MSFKRSATAVVLVAIVGVAIAVAAGARSQATITGAGATFPQPLIAVWQKEYKRDQVNYNGIGSGGGRCQIRQSRRNTMSARIVSPIDLCRLKASTRGPTGCFGIPCIHQPQPI